MFFVIYEVSWLYARNYINLKHYVDILLTKTYVKCFVSWTFDLRQVWNRAGRTDHTAITAI